MNNTTISDFLNSAEYDAKQDQTAKEGLANPEFYRKTYLNNMRVMREPIGPMEAMLRRGAAMAVPQGHSPDFYMGFFAGLLGALNAFSNVPRQAAQMMSVALTGAILNHYFSLTGETEEQTQAEVAKLKAAASERQAA